MEWLALVGLMVLLSFGYVLLHGAPYVPTLKPQVMTALDLLNLKTDQTLLELGCGDGKILMAAAQSGLQVVGYELNPFLALLCWLRTRRFKGRVRVVWGNFWRADLPPADGVFTFLHPRFMVKLDAKLEQQTHRPIRLASFAFAIPGRTPLKTVKGVFLYEYL